ncbi:MAG: hypothetical protein JJE40_18560 [Vicinamibacteria bacterium]|nr:hypothetical protein [Vicinamibacteria bacterium]
MRRQGRGLGAMAAAWACGLTWTLAAQSSDKVLVYADFEQVQDGRPVSARGGAMQLFGYSENTHRPPVFKGAAGLEPPGPELVHVKPEDPNRLGKFDVELFTPNQYSGVVLEIKGLPDQDGHQVADDVSGFKNFSVQLYTTGITGVRVELLTRGQGRDEKVAHPQVTFIPKPGLNTYRVPLKTFSQPSWVTDTRVDPKDVMKQLTSVNIIAYCDDCRPTKGMVIVDNVVFEK